MDTKSGSTYEFFEQMGVFRYPGETDAELRFRIKDRPVVIRARDAFYRIMDIFNKDSTLEGPYIKVIKVITDQRHIDMDDIRKFEPIGITDEER